MVDGPEELDEPRPRRAGVRWSWVVLGLALIVLAAVRLAVGGGKDSTPTPGPTPASSTPSTPSTHAAQPSFGAPDAARRDDEYVIAIPAQDMRAVLAEPACRGRCVAHNLTDAALTRAGGGFAGLRPLAGGLVTRGGSAYARTVEGYAQGDALVHLYAERVHLPATEVSVTESRGDGSRTVVLAAVRGGWRLTATLVVRGTNPPVTAAQAWVRRSPLPR